MAGFIGYPAGRVLAVFDRAGDADRAIEGLRALDLIDVERFEGRTDADRFDATGERHGAVARVLRTVQFSLMDQLPAMAWYEAALREGKLVLAVRRNGRSITFVILQNWNPSSTTASTSLTPRRCSEKHPTSNQITKSKKSWHPSNREGGYST